MSITEQQADEHFELVLPHNSEIGEVRQGPDTWMSNQELQRAFRAQEFEVYYQPVVSLPGRQLVGVEALVRWAHPRHGLIAPADFIPVAERCGLIDELGLWVLDTACRQVRHWHQHVPALAALRVAVNLSACQLTTSLPDLVSEVLVRSELPAHCLDLEITESVIMSDIDRSVQVLDRLAGLGVGLSIDDFGTGFSSLAYLKRFPLTTLKIDRSFVDDLNDDPREVSIVGAIIALAAALGLNQVAEGVENEAQCDQLESLGCAQAQGFLFSRPLPAADFVDRVGDLVEPHTEIDDPDPRPLVQVLVCDDDPTIRKLYRRALTNMHAEVSEVGDAEACIAHLTTRSVDLLILDIDLPRRTGLDALVDIHELAPHTQVVVVSGLISAEAARRALAAGAAACISKMQFLPVVRQLVEGCRP